MRGDDAAHDGGGGVDISARGQAGGDRGRIVVQMGGRCPEGERDSVLRGDVGAVAEFRGDLLERGVQQRDRPADTAGGLTVVEVAEDGGEEFRWGGPCSGPAGVRGLPGRESHRDRAADPLGMHMRHLGRPDRLGGNRFRITGEAGSQRRDPHGRAVAARALLIECRRGHLAPRRAPANPAQPPDGGEAVVAIGVAPPCEGGGEPILIDHPVDAQFGHHTARHLGVVGPSPRTARDDPRTQILHRGAHHGELLAERIPHRQALERVEHHLDIHCGSV